MRLLQELEHPAKEYTPIPFWFLNGDLREEELERQLEDFAAHGIYGVVLHPRSSSFAWNTICQDYSFDIRFRNAPELVSVESYMPFPGKSGGTGKSVSGFF